MSLPVFGLTAIKDKATRDAIQTIAMQAGGGSGSVAVQPLDPSDDQPGTEGDIIYASSTDSIWVFVATEWELAIGGNSTYIQVKSTVPRAAPDTDYSVWEETSNTFKNNEGDSKALVAFVVQNGAEFSNAQHEGFTYLWTKNGQEITDESSQQANTGVTKRAFIVTAADIENTASDAYICAVTY